MISSMVISPSVVESPAAQSDRGRVPRAMLTIMTSSSMVTSPLPLQSPGQRDTGVSVGDGVGVVVGVPVSVAVGVVLGVAVRVSVGVCVGVVVCVGVGVGRKTVTDPFTPLSHTGLPSGSLPTRRLVVRTEVPLAVAAMRNLHVYSNEPSGIAEVFEADTTTARILVHPGPGVHPIGT
jgi:hypothetical protein